LRSLVLDDRLLFVLASGFFVALFVLEVDAYGPLLSLLTAVVAARLLVGPPLGASIPRPLALAVLVLATVLAAGYLTAEAAAPITKALSRLGYMVVLALAILMLRDSGLLARHAAWLLGGGVLVRYLAWRVSDMPVVVGPVSHRVAAYALLTVPFLVFCLVACGRPRPTGSAGAGLPRGISRRVWVQAAIAVLLVMTLDLLFHTGSTPAFLGMLVALAIVLAFFTSRRERLAGLALIAATGGLLLVTDYGGVATEIWSQIENLAQEERVQIWSDTLSLFAASSLSESLVGHGVGAFRAHFDQVSDARYAAAVFPHNFALEIAYETGAAGLAAASLLVAWPLWSLARATWRAAGARRRFVGIAMLIAFLSWLVHAFLVFPFFSKETLYTFGILLGATLTFRAPTGSAGVADDIPRPTPGTGRTPRAPRLTP
jgi:O-antigen ligase